MLNDLRLDKRHQQYCLDKPYQQYWLIALFQALIVLDFVIYSTNTVILLKCTIIAFESKDILKFIIFFMYLIGHGNWNITHRGQLTLLLRAELKRLNPNFLHIVVLWDDSHSSIIDSLRLILEDILSIIGHRTAVTFVCSTSEVQLEINEKLVEPFQRNYWQNISTDRVHVAPPYVLSRHLSYNLPNLYQPEDDYQVPHKKLHRGKYLTYPDILPQGLRQNISRFLTIMYIRNERKPEKHILYAERKKFYSGSEITDLGLQNGFGIERKKMNELEKEFKNLSNDKKSHVSILCLKVDRGAGSSTLSKQFLYKRHKEYPCAQLREISTDSSELLRYIRDINNRTKLPLVLFVDEEISHPQDFLDFTKELVGCKNVNVILLLIVPAEVQKKLNSVRMKNVMDSPELRTCSFKQIELRRELTLGEMKSLTEDLEKIKNDRKTSEKLNKLNNKAMDDKAIRTFVHFGLTVFGHEYSGLKQFVELRIRIATDTQKAVLSFLSLIHIYTESLLPACALSSFLEVRKNVNLDDEFQHDYLRELLSPPADKNDLRRMSFLEVAMEVLSQLSSASSDGYWMFIKNVAVDLAKKVLSVNINTKSIDRLTRRLFVTSEYDESEKFSKLIRDMIKSGNRDIARDTFTELTEVFCKHSSFRAHILAHLAKYYMIVEKDFEEAKPRINEAIIDQPEDSLLRHIHGDIYLRHVKALKFKPNLDDLDDIVSCAIVSSASFKFVRHKRPHDSHGYMSDAMVRIIVMQAAKKYQEQKFAKSSRNETVSFVDYLVNKLDEMKKIGVKITKPERYLISLIPKAHKFLYEGVSEDYERKEDWKESFCKCIGPLSNLTKLSDKIREVKSALTDFRVEGNSIWLNEILLSIQSLNYGFKIDRHELTDEEIETRIKEIEECAAGSKNPEPLMNFLFRYSRYRKKTPSIEEVKNGVKSWLRSSKKRNKTSINAEFYKYVSIK